MKKLFNISVPIIIGAVIFCTQSFAGDNGKEKKNKEHLAKVNLPAASTPTCTFCCIDGTNVTITCNGTGMSKVIGRTCAEMNCSQADCPNAWSWSPSTYLSSTSVQKPTWAKGCGSDPGGSITYTITAWNSSSNCCALHTNTLTVTWPICNCSGRIGFFGADEEKDNKDIKVFPNPSTGKVIVEMSIIPSGTILQVYDINGALVKEMQVQEKTLTVDLSNQTKGNYFIQVINGEQGLLNKKIMIQ